MTNATDLDLIKECLEGKTQAFESLIEKYQKPIFNAALRMVNDFDDAQDVTQVVFIKAYEKLATYNSKFKFFSWIYRMVVNESINFVNRKRRFQELDPGLVSIDNNPEENLDQTLFNAKVQSALMYLQLDYRVVVILRHFEELSYKEMSYILDVPEKTVKSRLYSARQTLKDIFVSKRIGTHD